MHQAAKKGARPSDAPGFDDDDNNNNNDNNDDDDEEAAEAVQMVQMQQNFGGLRLGSEEIVGTA